MRYSWILIAAAVAALIVARSTATTAEAHAALVRSEPSAGAHLDTPPGEIRMWFAEPLETSYTGADLLDAKGNPVSGASVAIAPRDDQELILTPPADLPDGPYTVAWRTLSAADGHTMSGYFGFRIGGGTASGFVPTAGSPGDEIARPLTRGLALVGLASLLAMAPVILVVLDPVARSVPTLDPTLGPAVRRYAVVAAALALVTSGAALAAQAVAINPGSAIVAAVGQTLAQTRYGQLWLLRLLLLLLEVAAIAAALWGPPRRRSRRLLLAVGVGAAGARAVQPALPRRGGTRRERARRSPPTRCISWRRRSGAEDCSCWRQSSCPRCARSPPMSVARRCGSPCPASRSSAWRRGRSWR